MNIHNIAQHLNDLGDQANSGYKFDCQPISGDVDVLQVTVEGREEIPIFVSVTDDQILCISYLWGESEVIEEKQTDMYCAMLEMNIPMPLSSFAKVGDKYVVFGALSTNSPMTDIEHELVVLSDNAVDVIDDMSEYLN